MGKKSLKKEMPQNRPLRILHAISDSNIGGAGVQLGYLLQELGRRYPHRFCGEVLLPRDSALIGRFHRMGIKTHPLPIRGDASFSARDFFLLRRIIRDKRPDIVHTHGFLTARLAAKAAGVPLTVATRHCVDGRKMRFLSAALYNLVTDYTVATASAAKKRLVSEGVPASRIFTVPNGAKALRPLSKGEKAALREKWGIPPASATPPFVVGCFARLESVKGHDILLRAAMLLCERYPQVYFLIVGEGSLREKLEEQVKSVQRGRILFTGFVEDIAPLMNLVSVNVLCSRSSETTPLCLSEGFSLGVPCVATDVGGCGDMVKRSGCGFLVPRGDSERLVAVLSRLIEDPTLLSPLRKKAYAAFEKRYGAARMCREYANLYQRIGGMPE